MKAQFKFNNTRTLILDMRKQAGMTLMEIIAALAIIAAVIVGALSLFNSASSSNQAVTMLKDIIAIRAAVQQLYLGQGGYAGTAGGAVHTQLNTARKVPTDLTFIDAATGFRTPWGGALSIAPVTVGAATPQFTITLTAVPPDVCVQLVTNASNGWQSASVNGVEVAATPAAFPVTPAAASTNCVAAGATIIWTTPN